MKYLFKIVTVERYLYDLFIIDLCVSFCVLGERNLCYSCSGEDCETVGTVMLVTVRLETEEHGVLIKLSVGV